MSRETDQQVERLAAFIAARVPEDQWENGGLWAMDLVKLEGLRREYLEFQARVAEFKRVTHGSWKGDR